MQTVHYLIIGGGEPRRERMGLSGKARAQEKFSLDASVAHMEQLYVDALGTQKG